MPGHQNVTDDAEAWFVAKIAESLGKNFSLKRSESKCGRGDAGPGGDWQFDVVTAKTILVNPLAKSSTSNRRALTP
jgi:hypothetical protein